jgi:hypothetical protein
MNPDGRQVPTDIEAKFLLAAKLYELGKLSSGQAARLGRWGRTKVSG